jgi:signal transduction histidine kinase
LIAEFKANTLIIPETQLSSAVDQQLSPAARAALFQIAQEALANVAKHARASRVLIRLDMENGAPFLQIEDNGAGLPTADTPRRIGHGLMNMAKRAQTVGAKFEVASAPGKGTTVWVRLPAQ